VQERDSPIILNGRRAICQNQYNSCVLLVRPPRERHAQRTFTRRRPLHTPVSGTPKTMYCYLYDGIVLTWMLGTLSVELQEIVREPSETTRQAWLAIEG
jgi:hypothetical protein